MGMLASPGDAADAARGGGDSGAAGGARRTEEAGDDDDDDDSASQSLDLADLDELLKGSADEAELDEASEPRDAASPPGPGRPAVQA